MSDIVIEGKNLKDIDQSNFQSVGPYTNENNEVFEPWQGRNIVISDETTDESVEFIISKLEPGDDYGNHRVEGYSEPSTPWILSDDYPRNTLREKCEN